MFTLSLPLQQAQTRDFLVGLPRTMVPPYVGLEVAGLSGNVASPTLASRDYRGRVVGKTTGETAAGRGNGADPSDAEILRSCRRVGKTLSSKTSSRC